MQSEVHVTGSPAYADQREHVGQLIGAALQAADPEAAVRRHLSLLPDGVRVGQSIFRLKPESRVYIIALGKAAPAMARSACDVLGARVEAGIATTLTLAPSHISDRVQIIAAGHPLPDAGSLVAGQAALDLARRAGRGDIILALISGGGSAMAECPVPGVELDDLRQLTGLLLHAGAPIAAINSIRGELSLLKAGGLARAAAPAQVVGLLFSDVVGDDPASIASGPTVTRASRHGTGRQMLERYGCWDAAPEAVRHGLASPIAQKHTSPPPCNLIIGRNEDMLHAVADQARAIGFPIKVLTTRMQGEAFTVGARLGNRLASAPRPICLLAGGETTVTIRQGGRGGRNQELALGAALALDGTPRCALIALASDGIDGPTDAAGACVDGETVARARALGLNPREAAEAHDSYPLLDQLGALLRTGPTGTNLTDLVIGLAYS
jgi:hydroxypyruvate reductase